MACLSLELLSYDTTTAALRMVGVGVRAFPPGRYLSARVFEVNRFVSIRRQSIGEIERHLSARKFNIADVTESPRVGACPKMRLSLSPNHQCWADTRQAGGGSLKIEAFRGGLESIQLRVALMKVKHYPTSLTARIPIVDVATGRSLWLGALTTMAEALRAARIEAAYFGAADMAPEAVGGLTPSMAYSLDSARGGSDANKWRFDSIHDFMVCPEPLADRLTSMVGDGVVTETVTGPVKAVVVAIPRHRREQVETMARSAGLLAEPRAELPEVGPTTYPIRSMAEYRELDARGMVPRVAWDEVVHPIMNEVYSKAVGIHPEQMVVLVVHRLMAREMERDVGKSVDPDPSGPPERVIAAFERVYQGYLNREYARRIFDRIRGLQSREQL